MSDLPKDLCDSILHGATVTSTKHVQEKWQRGEQSVTARLESAKREREIAEAHLETAKREREAAEAEVRLLDEESSKVFDFLVKTFSTISPDAVRLAWEAQGDLVPPGIRRLLDELRGAAQPLPSPALSSADGGFPGRSIRPSVSDGTERRDDSISVRSESLMKDPSSVTHPTHVLVVAASTVN
jgi:hypothetical protein